MELTSSNKGSGRLSRHLATDQYTKTRRTITPNRYRDLDAQLGGRQQDPRNVSEQIRRCPRCGLRFYFSEQRRSDGTHCDPCMVELRPSLYLPQRPMLVHYEKSRRPFSGSSAS